jgi:16S rRNA (guanine527-N7)-methyltransferase
LRIGGEGFGLELSETQVVQFITYLYELKRWNQVHQLTAITHNRDIIIKHFVDSLSPFRVWSSWEGLNLLDVGSGAGLPGLALKLACPGVSLFLLEASEKRVAFLHHLVGLLQLKGVHILHRRLESLDSEGGYRHYFDRIVSRGFGRIALLREKGKVLLRDQGVLVLYGAERAGRGDEMPTDVERIVVPNPCSSQIRNLWIIHPYKVT